MRQKHKEALSKEATQGKFKAAEIASLLNYCDREESHIGGRVKIVSEAGKAPSIAFEPEHWLTEYLFLESFASADPNFGRTLITQIANAMKVRGVCNEALLNFAISVDQGCCAKKSVGGSACGADGDRAHSCYGLCAASC
jgi:hypothetical protein